MLWFFTVLCGIVLFGSVLYGVLYNMWWGVWVSFYIEWYSVVYCMMLYAVLKYCDTVFCGMYIVMSCSIS